MNNLTLYSNNCPQCKILKKILSEKSIDFNECNDIDTMVSLGIDHVPVLSVGGKLLGFKEALKMLEGDLK